jgi:hypothetical protein
MKKLYLFSFKRFLEMMKIMFISMITKRQQTLENLPISTTKNIVAKTFAKKK